MLKLALFGIVLAFAVGVGVMTCNANQDATANVDADCDGYQIEGHGFKARYDPEGSFLEKPFAVIEQIKGVVRVLTGSKDPCDTDR